MVESFKQDGYDSALVLRGGGRLRCRRCGGDVSGSTLALDEQRRMKRPSGGVTVISAVRPLCARQAPCRALLVIDFSRRRRREDAARLLGGLAAERPTKTTEEI